MIFALAKIAAAVAAIVWVRRIPAVSGVPEETAVNPVVPEEPEEPNVPEIPNPPDVQRTPGDSYDNPVPSTSVTPGFKGFLLVTSGDSLIKIVRRLGRADVEWNKFILPLENQWAVALCTVEMRAKYYGGNKGITLTRQYGTQPGVNCVAPGYGPGYPLLKYASGSFPVLYWSGE